MWHFIYFKPKLTSVTEPLLSFSKLTMGYDFLQLKLHLKSTHVQKIIGKYNKWEVCYASFAIMFLILILKNK